MLTDFINWLTMPGKWNDAAFILSLFTVIGTIVWLKMQKINFWRK